MDLIKRLNLEKKILKGIQIGSIVGIISLGGALGYEINDSLKSYSPKKSTEIKYKSNSNVEYNKTRKVMLK